MNISYQGIGQRCATFMNDGAKDGALVKLSANGTVAPCEADEDFIGVVAAASRDGEACTVQLGGFVTLGYTGAPTLGYCALVADGAGGVKDAEDASRSLLVVERDETAKTVTVML